MVEEGYCCNPFKEAYDDGVINKPKPDIYRSQEGLDANKFYLWDRDCYECNIRIPISFCPYCGKDLTPGLEVLFEK